MPNLKKLFLKIVTGAVISFLAVGTASAAVLSGMSDTMSSVKLGALSNHTFVFTTPSGLTNGSTTVITFPSDFGILPGLTFSDVDINVGGAYVGSTTLAAVPIANTLGVVRTSSSTLTITASSSVPIPPASTVYIRIGTNAIWAATGVNQVINATSTVGSKAIGIAGSMWDSGTTTVNIITNDTVSVNAIVPQALSFAISANSINFGNLDATFPKYASSTNASGDTAVTIAHTLTVSTNAPTGYSITVQGQTLTSQQNSSNTINAVGASPAPSSFGTEQFGVYATKAGGTNGTIATPYATALSYGYNATATTSALFASGTSATVTETYSLRYLANISGLTEAGNYSANLIYVGTANF
jgi:hypothetical protein